MAITQMSLVLVVLGSFIIQPLNGQLFQLSQSEDCGSIDENPNDLRTVVPWTAGIYARANSKQQFRFLITGTVLSPYVVLTVFAGAYGESARKGGKYFISPPDNHLVAVGLKSNSLQDVDRHTQIAEVSHIVPFGAHEPENRKFHIFVFHLKKPLNLDTPYVRAACLPVFLKTLPSSGHGSAFESRQGGFGSPTNPNGSSDLKVINITLGTEDFCTRMYKGFYQGTPDHVNCGTAHVSGNPAPVCTLHGSGRVTPVYNGRWFLVGTTALIPSIKTESHWCNRQTIYFYDSSTASLDWLLHNIKCAEEGKFACVDGSCLPWTSLCDQRSDCSLGADEDPILCRAMKPCIYSGKTFECGVYGVCIEPSKVCDRRKDCGAGEDEQPGLCLSRQLVSTRGPAISDFTESSKTISRPKSPNPSLCSPMQVSEGVSISCNNPVTGDKVLCDEAGVGTVARLGCERYYKSAYRLPTTEMKCQADGAWNPYRPFVCEPDCGVLSSELTPFIISGQAATRRDAFPWHASLFFKKNNEFVFICGGSLIERNVIITAAHCVSDATGSMVPKYNFKIILGAVSSAYRKNSESPNAQIFNVKHVWVPATYDRRSLQSDIAIVQLEKPAVFGEFVRPICYLSQTSSNAVPSPGQLGKVPGFGYVDDTSIAEKLQFAAFPVISTDECIKSLRRIPPLSTFCAGYKNGSSVCQGDSGSGMAFPEQVGSGEKYVLKGLVSHGEVKEGKLCDPHNYAVFTHIDAYADWILQRLERIVRR